VKHRAFIQDEFRWMFPLIFASVACVSSGTEKNIQLSQTHFLLGADYLNKKMPEAAKEELFKSIHFNPENKNALQLLGVYFFFEGVHKINILEREQCLKATAAVEQRQEVNKDFREAESYFLKTITIAKREQQIDSESLIYLANISIHLKKFDDAIRYAQQALENVLYASRHLGLGAQGWAYFQKGQLREAARDLRQAVYHEPKFCVGRFRLAKVYFSQNAYDDAIRELTKIAEDSTCPLQEARQLLGLIYLKRHEMQLALENFQKCKEISSTSCLAEECQRYEKSL